MDRHQRHRHRTQLTPIPDKDPLKVNFVDLRTWVMALPGFDDDANRCGEKILEAIQQAWIDEVA